MTCCFQDFEDQRRWFFFSSVRCWRCDESQEDLGNFVDLGEFSKMQVSGVCSISITSVNVAIVIAPYDIFRSRASTCLSILCVFADRIEKSPAFLFSIFPLRSTRHRFVQKKSSACIIIMIITILTCFLFFLLNLLLLLFSLLYYYCCCFDYY